MEQFRQNNSDNTSLIQLPHHIGIYKVIFNSQQELAVIRTLKGYFYLGEVRKKVNQIKHAYSENVARNWDGISMWEN